MSQRFIIDININGAQSERGSSDIEKMDLAASGAVLAGSASIMKKLGMPSSTEFEKFLDIEEIQKRGDIFTEKDKKNNHPGYVAHRKSYIKEVQDIKKYHEENPVDTEENLKNISSLRKTLAAGSLVGWKALHATTDIANHKSGNAAENQKRNNSVKSLSYLGVFVANPMAGTALMLNEGVNMLTSGIKYSYDRKMEDKFITNSGAVLGDVSYGRSRGMGI